MQPMPSPDEFRAFLEGRALAARMMGLRPCVVSDRDGTMASVSWVRPTEAPGGNTTGWHRFNAGLPFDAVVPYVRDLMAAVPDGIHRFMFSGRAMGDRKGEDFRYWQMLAWIRKNAVPVDTLLMRQAADQRRDSLIKNEFADAVEAQGFVILAAIDDREQVCREVWDARGIPLVQVVDPAIPPMLLRSA